LCLLSHIDVVTAEADKWPKGKGPLSGTLDEHGMIWGRGALDMKGLGTLELMTMVLLKRAQVPLRRSIILLAVAAEETDSGGIRFVTDKHWGKIGCSHAINEGGIGVKDLLSEGQTIYTISSGEKGFVWIKMTAHGEAGHGSVPIPGRAPERLQNALNRLATREPVPALHPTIYELAARAGADLGGLKGFVLSRPFLVDAVVVPALMDNPPARAALIDTVNVTGFEGRNEPNVIPSEVSAILDCRILPTTKRTALIDELKRLIDDPDVTLTVIDSQPGLENEWDDPLFHALARHAVDGREHVVAAPILSPGYTDSLFLRRKGVRAYGFVPFEVTRDELKSYHGRDERVSAENVRRGLRALYRAVVDVSAK
jgi:acetylornithine deacetylase/succinyl-diaminopimelate desuccinylase-like protein